MAELLNHKTYGEGDEHLIILHGLFGTLDNWASHAREWAAHKCVHCLDLRNHGKSFWSDEMSYELMARDVVDYIEEKNLGTAIVLGHSMGAKVAMMLAEQNQALVEKLIIADMAMRSYPARHQEVFEALDAVPLNSLDQRSDAAEYMKEHLEEESVIQFLMKNLNRQKDGSYSWKMNLEAIRASYEEIIGAVDLKEDFPREVLVISGSKSNYVGEEDIEEMEMVYPMLEWKQLEAGHWLHAEKPEEFQKAILEFID